jgi:formate C-acetyltransferase
MGAIEADFEGYEDVLALCKSVPKYGSDTEHTNAHARRLATTAAELVIEKSRPYLKKYGLFLEPCMQSDTWHLKFGETFGATPDGRRAGASFSQNARPSNGACTSGITGMLNSMLSIPSDSLVSGALNLDLRPSEFEGEQGRVRFSALLASYFNRGGMHAQVSCVGRNELVDAQANPEKHKDLRVRVTGYSGIFVDICKKLQDDIINRMD